MPTGYHHLTTPERCQIYALKASGYSLRAIAREMSQSHSTISRELRRNSGGRGYRHQPAEQIAGRLRREGVVAVSPEWIYQLIRRGRKGGGVLWRCLRRRGKRPNVTARRDSGWRCIPHRVDISARPACVEAKRRGGTGKQTR